ncbi:hypothetical protein Salat_0532400 [Sesamum alatum]|uniref:Uncharacterized protein n=1 Tax=Sesamum alatum TaxID=300844 RepID=A0AAE2CTA0_9LAMI|nr:hypothetical protein Salat_0532400 [Sesamum alatum]
MNEYCRSEEGRSWCYFHPTEVVVGICPLCLNQRLLVLASKQAYLHQTRKFFSVTPKRSAPLALTNIFALLNRLDTKQQKPDDDDDDQYNSHCTSSPEDSFISIKFEENGVASWDKGSKMPGQDRHSEVSLNDSWDNKGKKIKTVVEHGKPRATLRWIGHLLQLIRWKRSSKANMCHVGTKLEGGSRVKYGWVKTLTKRRAKE